MKFFLRDDRKVVENSSLDENVAKSSRTGQDLGTRVVPMSVVYRAYFLVARLTPKVC